MAAIDDEQNDLDAAEGLVDLNRIALQDLPINREDEEMEGIAVNGPYDESDLLSTQYSSRKEAYRALQLDSYHRTKLKGLYQIISGKNVCRVVCMGDKLKLDEGKKNSGIRNRSDSSTTGYVVRTAQSFDGEPRRKKVIIT